MKTALRLFAVLSTLGLAAAGCSDDPLAKLEEFSERMCQCQDSACAKQVNDELVEWMKDNASAEDPDDADAKKATALMNEMVECAKKASLGGAEPAAGEPGKK